MSLPPTYDQGSEAGPSRSATAPPSSPLSNAVVGVLCFVFLLLLGAVYWLQTERADARAQLRSQRLKLEGVSRDTPPQPNQKVVSSPDKKRLDAELADARKKRDEALAAQKKLADAHAKLEKERNEAVAARDAAVTASQAAEALRVKAEHARDEAVASREVGEKTTRMVEAAMKEAAAKLKAVENDRVKAEEARNRAEAERDAARTLKDETAKALLTATQVQGDLQKALERSEAARTQAMDLAKKQSVALDAARSELAAVEKARDEALATVDSVRGQLSKSENDRNDLIRARALLQKDLQAAKGLAAGLQRNQKDLTEAHDKAKARIAELTASLSKLTDEHAATLKDRDDLKKSLVSAQESIKRFQEQQKALEVERQRIEVVRKESELSVKDMTVSLKEKTLESKDYAAKAQQLSADLKRLMVEFNALQNEHQKLRRQLDAGKKVNAAKATKSAERPL